MKEIIYQDSYTLKLGPQASLKVYLDMNKLEECEKKLKNFFKIKNFIGRLQHAK